MLPWRGRRETMNANGIVSYTVDSPRQSGDHEGAFHSSLSVLIVVVNRWSLPVCRQPLLR